MTAWWKASFRPGWSYDPDWYGFLGTLAAGGGAFLACLVFGVPN